MRTFLQMLALFCVSIFVTLPASAGEWQEGAPSSTGLAFAASALLGDEIYVAGGAGISTPQSSFEAYDTIGDIWRSLPALPMGVQQAALATVNGRLYLSGGYLAQSNGPDNASFWVFDPSVGFWVQGPDMPAPRAWHKMTGVNGRLYVIGGVGSHAERIFVFDPVSDSWETLAVSFPAARAALALVVHNGNILAIGGRLTNGAPTPRVDILDLEANVWHRGPALPEPRASLGAAVFESQVHVAGGEQVSPPRTFDTHYVLNDAGTSWETSTPLNTPRHGMTMAATTDSLFVIGGATGPGVFTVFTVSDLVSIYKP